MFGVSDYGAFVAAIGLFLLISGPVNLALVTPTSKGGIAACLAWRLFTAQHSSSPRRSGSPQTRHDGIPTRR